MTDDTITAYPLAWPAGWPRTEQRTRSAFTVDMAKTRKEVVEELERLGATDIVISANVPLRRDGLLRVIQTEPADPGVAVYFTLDGESRCMPCDRWDRVKDNIRAIQKTVEALRGIERWGASAMTNAAFAGFAALPASSSASGWWTVLGVDRDASASEVLDAYRRMVLIHHPDKGGSAEMFHMIQGAKRQYEAERNPAVIL